MDPMVSSDAKLTEEEQAAVGFLFRLSGDADNTPCDTDLTNFEPSLPSWYDDAKFKRAQRYFADNRGGIFGSNMVSLISLLAQHKGLQILCATGRSSTADTARKRYVSTILHTLSWYECDLTPGSQSWESLMRVRKLHLNASRSAQSKKIGMITQTEMTVTQFGFMGFALIRPDVFGIAHDNEKDIEAFIHLWAVIGYMLGIKDEFNFCLMPVNVVKKVSETIMRYFILPAVQLESPQFKAMTEALVDGLKQFVPYMSYEIQMFLTRRAVCVPGYQYNRDREQERLCPSFISEEGIQTLLKERSKITGYEYMEFVFFHKVPVYNFTKNTMVTEVNGNIVSHKPNVPEDVIVENGKSRPMDDGFRTRLRKYLDLDESTSITLTLVDYETEWKNALNDSKFYELSLENQKKLAFREKLRKLFSGTRFGTYVMDWLFSFLMWRFRRYLSSS